MIESRVIRDQLITTFRREQTAGENKGGRAEQTNTPADRTIDPGLAQFPANEKPFFIVEQVCLRWYSATLQH
jgi:hypothetical protein